MINITPEETVSLATHLQMDIEIVKEKFIEISEQGKMIINTTDGDSRTIGPGDIIHLEDVAPCRGHITKNLAAGATFLQFVQ